jgi:hypothetical protein
LDGVLNMDAFRASYASLTEKHSILRTRFRVENDVLLEQVVCERSPTLDVVDLSDQPSSERGLTIWRRLKDRHRKPASLADGALDLCIFRLDEREHLLGGFIHHVAMDATSLRVMLGELMAGYYGRILGKETGAEPAVQYLDYALWEQTWLSEDEKRLSDYSWICDFGAAGLEPVGIDAAGYDPTSFDIEPIEISASAWGRVSEGCKALGITANAAVLTATTIVLARSRGATRAALAHLYHGRPPGFESTVGSFVQMRPFIATFDYSESVADIFQRGRSTLARSYDLRRPVSDSIMRAYGVDRVVVNFSNRDQRARGANVPLKPAPHSSNGLPSAGVRGVFTTTTVREPFDRGPTNATHTRSRFSSSRLTDAGGSFSDPQAGRLSVRRRVSDVGRRPGSGRLLGVAGHMTILPKRLQSEFHRDLHIGVTQADGVLKGALTYNSQAYSRTAVLVFIRDIERLLEAFGPNSRASLESVMTLF